MLKFVKEFRFFFAYAALFSLVINFLLLTPTIYMLQVFDRVMSSQSVETLVMLTIFVIGALVIMGALELVRSRLLVSASIALDIRLSATVLGGLLANAAKLEKNDYVHGLRDVNSLKTFLAGSGVFALFDIPWFPFYIAIIYFMHPLLALIAVIGSVLMFTLALCNARATRKPLEDANVKGRQAGGYVEASLRNAEAVNAMGMLSGVVRRWSSYNKEVMSLQTLASDRGGVITALSKFTRQALQSLMVGTGAFLIINNHSSPGIMIAATLILGRALAPVEMAIATWKGLVDARAAYNRLDTLLKEGDDPRTTMELPLPQGSLELEKVVFGFKTTNKAIIKGVSFALAPGESLGIIGPSAAGKSTLARIMIGVWQPNNGLVRLDGADMATLPRERVGAVIGYLPQDIELFPGTVAENICRLGDAAALSEEIIAAATIAGVHDMILKLPQGYNTDLGAGGATLSGGQRQRIALARALFGSPRLVVLDEPNSNLDTEGEESLTRAFKALKQQGATTIIITHRPAILAGVDKMLVLQDGAVALFGPRNEVLAKVMPQAQPQTHTLPPPGAMVVQGVAHV